MAKYTEEQLLEIREEAYVPQQQILDAFNKLIDQVKEHAAAEHERHKAIKWSNGDTYLDEHGNERPYHHMNRRRASRTSTHKPNLRKKSVETVHVDEDGWATLSKTKKSFGAEDGAEEKAKFREAVGVKARPNNKNLGSSKAVDPREVLADKHTRAFNAFEALEDNDDDDE
ncbi:CAF20 [[Candida] subhashii]|uniref:Cap-associated protein CAF20 n=1 Tax=[Candida] subhashii TaxID=561895 RepID=A0A8J5QQH5_9ASCO|nr:CAF20 [[Candida] subhashii]KAG7663577.1 CAF20 [[Candida] subhashii]